jgi:hypothetical protein
LSIFHTPYTAIIYNRKIELLQNREWFLLVISTIDQFWAHILSKYKINKVDLIYKEGQDHRQYAVKGRDLLLNPNLWDKLIKKKDYPAIHYIIDTHPQSIDFQIMSIVSPITTISDNIALKIFDTFLEHNSNEKRRAYEFDVLAMACLTSDEKDYTSFKRMINFMIDHNITPQYEAYGNICNGEGLAEAAKLGNPDLVNYLISLGADPSKNDSWSFVHACKHACYEVALLLANHGADVHTKNDLGLKMIERNDKAKVLCIGKAAECREKLLGLYN